MRLQNRVQLDRGEVLYREICALEYISNVLLSVEDITALKLYLTCGAWFHFQRKAAEEGRKKAVAVIHNVTIFQIGQT